MSNFAAALFIFVKTNSWWHCSVWCSTSNPVSQLAVFTAKPLWQAFGLRAFAARRKTNLVETVARRARNRYCYCETWLTWHSVVLGGVFLCVSSVRDSGALWLRSNCWAQTSTYYAATTCLKCYRAGTRPIRVKSYTSLCTVTRVRAHFAEYLQHVTMLVKRLPRKYGRGIVGCWEFKTQPACSLRHAHLSIYSLPSPPGLNFEMFQNFGRSACFQLSLIIRRWFSVTFTDEINASASHSWRVL